MHRTPPLTPRSGMTGLGLVLLVVLVAGGLVLFLTTGTAAMGGRRSEAAERGARPRPVAVEPEGTTDDGRAAPAVELVPAGTSGLVAPSAADAAGSAAVSAVAKAGAEPEQELALAAPGDANKIEGPALKHQREGKTELVVGKEQRRDRRADRMEREAEQAAAGILDEKKPVEATKKNVDRSQVQRKGSQVGKPERRPKKEPPAEPAQDGPP